MIGLCLLGKICGKFERLLCACRVAQRDACLADYLPVCGLHKTVASRETVRFSGQRDCLRILALGEAQLRKFKPQPGIARFDTQRALQR